MSEMVERVAKAIYKKLQENVNDYVGEYQNRYGMRLTQVDGDFDLEAIASAALEGMRKPTKAMLDASMPLHGFMVVQYGLVGSNDRRFYGT